MPVFRRAIPALAIAAGAAIVLAAGGSVAAAQRVIVRGVAWDSLRHEALPGAMVSIVGSGRSTIADPRGRFEFDTVAPGAYTLLMSHDALDSLGLTGVSSKVNVTDGRQEVRLALPSFAAFWRSSCSGRAPRDSSLVYGVVRRPGTGTPVPNARVEVAWLDLATRDRRSVDQKFKRIETSADSTGNFGFCGVPNGSALRIRASTDALASGTIDLLPAKEPVRWRDLAIGPVPNGDPFILGTVAGVVLRQEGQPFPDVRVAIDDVPGEIRTDSAGRFMISRVPAGTRQLQVAAVGQTVVSRIFDVAPRDTARLVINMDRVTTLGSVRVSGEAFSRRIASGLLARQKLGIGRFVDSSQISKQGTIRAAFEAAAGLKIVNQGGRKYTIVAHDLAYRDCAAVLVVDGVRQIDQEILWTMHPDQIGMVEVYNRASMVPSEYQYPRQDCGVVAVWTKRYFP